VFFHGTFVFRDDQKHNVIEAVIPKIDHHVYLAGTWLGETALRKGDYELNGVATGKGTFDRSLNLSPPVSKSKSGSNSHPVHATLRLPRPDKITSLSVTKVPFNSFDNAAGLKPKGRPQQIPTLQVFTYRIEDANNLLLKLQQNKSQQDKSQQDKTGPGHYWEPVFNGDVINLHIFSAEDHCDGPPKVPVDFVTCMNIIGSQLTLTRIHPTSGISEDETLPAGVIPEETEDLEPRTRRMARLGRLLRENGDLNQAWYKNDALDKQQPTCGSYVS